MSAITSLTKQHRLIGTNLAPGCYDRVFEPRMNTNELNTKEFNTNALNTNELNTNELNTNEAETFKIVQPVYKK